MTRALPRPLLFGLMLLLALVAALPAAAQSPARPTHINASLVARQSDPAPGSIVPIAIAMNPEAGWHGYWVNGGDAGFGMEIDWQLPAGVTALPLSYPVPTTLIIGGLMNHVYEQPYALLGAIAIPVNVPPGTRLPIVARAQWLACTDQVCVPEQAELTLELVAGAGNSEPDARFDRWQQALPQPLGQPARFTVTGGTLRIAIPLPASVALRTPHLFVESVRANQPGGGQRFLRDGDTLIVEMPAGSDATDYGHILALLRLAPGRGLAIDAVPGDVPTVGSEIARVEPAQAPPMRGTTHGALDPAVDAVDAVASFDYALFLSALFGAVIGGLILNIMPCVFPILSLKALALARAGDADERAVRREGLAYTAGAVLACAALGALLLLLRAGGEQLGWAFQLQRPESVVLLIVLMAAITANLAGLFDFAGMSFSTRVGGNDPVRNALATGALAAFVATPCTGPFLGAALGATLTLPPWAAVPVFGALGLGLALPFLALALVPALRRRLPRPGPWMETLRRWLAVPMALTALALVWLLGRQVGSNGWLIGGAVLVAVLALGWWAGRQQRGGGNASPALLLMAALIVPAAAALPAQQAVRTGPSEAADALNSQPWNAAAVDAALAEGRPVFVYFTADWCVTCKVNEAAAINTEATEAAFRSAGVASFVADWTSADPAITAELARHGRNSVPLYLWYRADGAPPEVLPQILTPAMLAERAQRQRPD